MSDTDTSDEDISVTTETSILRETRSHVTIEWEIKEFFDPSKKIGYCLDSPSFVLSRAKWFIRIYPNGKINDDDWVSIYLFKKHPTSERLVSYTIGIKKAGGSVFKSMSARHNFKQNEKSWGWPQFYKKSALLDIKDVLAPDGVLTIFCSVNKIKDDHTAEVSSQTVSPDSYETLSQNFKDLFRSGSEVDVTFKVKDKEFVAHKIVLAARSSVFRAMFKTDMEEKDSGIVKIVDSDPASFEDFLVFLYSGKLDVVSSSNTIGLFLLAEKYNLKELMVACSECLAREICDDSICDVVHLASLHNEPELLETATEFFVKHAKTVLATPKWFSFLTEHTTLANELLLKMANKYIK